MAKKIKIDPAELKQRMRKTPERKVGGIPLRKYHLIGNYPVDIARPRQRSHIGRNGL
jgi:hypothetical protein